MLNVAHIYASKAKFNSGDFMIGIAVKEYFKQVILKENNIKFSNFDCRQYYDINKVNQLNNYDYIIVGAGGLILPDSPNGGNKVSCWQWNIPKINITKINKPIYVISIGWNLFYNQTINMPKRQNNFTDTSRLSIFKDNITTLVDKSVHFTLRHNNDVNKLLDVIGSEYENKVKYEMCPTVWYATKFWKQKINTINQKYIAIEIKDDREW